MDDRGATVLTLTLRCVTSGRWGSLSVPWFPSPGHGDARAALHGLDGVPACTASKAASAHSGALAVLAQKRQGQCSVSHPWDLCVPARLCQGLRGSPTPHRPPGQTQRPSCHFGQRPGDGEPVLAHLSLHTGAHGHGDPITGMEDLPSELGVTSPC